MTDQPGHAIEIECDDWAGHNATIRLDGETLTTVEAVTLTLDAQNINRVTLTLVPRSIRVKIRADVELTETLI